MTRPLAVPPDGETPPRAWGRHALKGSALAMDRNTPTGVGKTVAGVGGKFGVGKHPHGRGEDTMQDGSIG